MAYRVHLLSKCDEPLLESAECAIILTMAESTRLERFEAQGLTRLARTTYVQVNFGRHGGRKPVWVTNSAYDIVHAYRHACELCKDMGYVLILEDDAEFMPDVAVTDFESVDQYVRTERPFAYTLGSAGFCVPLDGRHFRIGVGLGVAYSQAILWSAELRRRLLETREGEFMHIDGHFLSRAQIATFHKPLVVQLFPPTQNMATWSLFGCSAWLKPIDSFCIGTWIALLRTLKLDRENTHWATLYAFQTHIPIYVGLWVGIYTMLTLRV